MPQRRRGANIVEFALTLPIFMAILLGLIDYGWVFASQSGIDAATMLACREGSMVDAIFKSPITEAEEELNERAAPWCTGGNCTLSVAPRYTVPDRAIECSVQMPFRPLIGFVPLPATLEARSIYRLEWQRQGNL
ncbi:MAG: TadE family protein [Myxococcota bacterium]